MTGSPPPVEDRWRVARFWRATNASETRSSSLAPKTGERSAGATARSCAGETGASSKATTSRTSSNSSNSISTLSSDVEKARCRLRSASIRNWARAAGATRRCRRGSKPSASTMRATTPQHLLDLVAGLAEGVAPHWRKAAGSRLRTGSAHCWTASNCAAASRSATRSPVTPAGCGDGMSKLSFEMGRLRTPCRWGHGLCVRIIVACRSPCFDLSKDLDNEQ